MVRSFCESGASTNYFPPSLPLPSQFFVKVFLILARRLDPIFANAVTAVSLLLLFSLDVDGCFLDSGGFSWTHWVRLWTHGVVGGSDAKKRRPAKKM